MSKPNWQKLAAMLHQENAILGGRVSPRELKTLYTQGHADIITQGKEIVAFCALWPTPSTLWRELGSLWVAQNVRGNKLASRVFHVLMEKCSTPCFLITTNEKVVHLAQQHGMSEATRENWYDAVPCGDSCGICDRVSQPAACTFRARTHPDRGCRLFYRH